MQRNSALNNTMKNSLLPSRRHLSVIFAAPLLQRIRTQLMMNFIEMTTSRIASLPKVFSSSFFYISIIGDHDYGRYTLIGSKGGLKIRDRSKEAGVFVGYKGTGEQKFKA